MDESVEQAVEQIKAIVDKVFGDTTCTQGETRTRLIEIAEEISSHIEVSLGSLEE